jgi:carbon starvation protein
MRLVSSGTTPKLVDNEVNIRMIGYGGMLMESFVGIMAMICATVLDPGIYFAINAPAAVLGTTVDTAAEAVRNLGFVVTPEMLTVLAQEVVKVQSFLVLVERQLLRLVWLISFRKFSIVVQ